MGRKTKQEKFVSKPQGVDASSLCRRQTTGFTQLTHHFLRLLPLFFFFFPLLLVPPLALPPHC